MIIATAAISAYYLLEKRSNSLKTQGLMDKTITGAQGEPAKIDRAEEILITDGETYGELMKQASTSYATAMKIYDAAKPRYDFVKIRSGRIIELIYDKDTDELKKLTYKIDSENELSVQKICASSIEQKKYTQTSASSTENAEAAKYLECNWQATIFPIPYEVKIKTAGGIIESSMYQAAIDNNIDIRAIIELANAFQWTIDFAMDPRVDDKFKFVYEERYLDGEYIMPGQILAGYYVNSGEKFSVYYFEESEENQGFFDENGNSVQKMFLKAPVAFKYISSGYTTGPRYIAAFKAYTPTHMAIDYAAAIGTPVRAVGDGTVTYAGWNSHGYGNFLSIRHNGTYTTNYAHLNGFAVKYGQKVKQGNVVAYVGSTGYSTGPHLHYEMVKNGIKINPLKEVLPPGKPIKEENRGRFFEKIKKYQGMLED